MFRLFSLYSLKFPTVIVYMLQACEYETLPYIKWLIRTKDFSKVMNRRNLDKTHVATLLLAFIFTGYALQTLAAVTLGIIAYNVENPIFTLLSIITLLLTPIVWSYLVIIPMLIAKQVIIKPKLAKQLAETKQILSSHRAIKIAVAGSYGKTTMKELLVAVLSEGKRVAATPGNKNVATAHYDFAKSLTGDEDILVIELGEGRPGDVERFAHTIQPDIAVITGVAPAHLDHYSDVSEVGGDIFSLAAKLAPKDVFVNTDSPDASDFIKQDYTLFNMYGVAGWEVSEFNVTIHGSTFKLTKNNQQINVKTGLLGDHLIGVMSAAAVIAIQSGLTIDQVESGLAKTLPYEHRMQPYALSGAWVIDDAYNGNIEGVKAGTRLLGMLEAKRKIYVTPGLVDQGANTNSIHKEVGKMIAAANPDIVVLMNNSVTAAITAGLESAGFTGDLQIKHDPLNFYTNLEHFIAAGDVVMLQNDWTDNYQ